jgi:hypothetical protein
MAPQSRLTVPAPASASAITDQSLMSPVNPDPSQMSMATGLPKRQSGGS